jgi:hypothetical protein
MPDEKPIETEQDKDRAHRLKVWAVREGLTRYKVRMASIRYAGLLAVILVGLLLAYMVASDIIGSTKEGPRPGPVLRETVREFER